MAARREERHGPGDATVDMVAVVAECLAPVIRRPGWVRFVHHVYWPVH